MKDRTTGSPEIAAIDTAHTMQAKTARPRAAAGRRALLVLPAVAGLFTAVPLLGRKRSPKSVGLDLVLHACPREVANLRLSNDVDRPTSLAAFRGKIVLLNRGP
ncbi:hypothetical protein [Devosia sp.]|uniref:hypothetical protein n=1 Tax=Devosia sp. TaxID=1871048 RepID=UPI002FC6E19B